MHLQTACVLACISLHFAVSVSQWEVINDVKPYDDSGTQEEILSEEEFIIFRPDKPKPQRVPNQPAINNVDTRDSRKMMKVPVPPAREIRRARDGGNDFGEELLPLGVGGLSNRRRLLQINGQGPTLPPDVELKRQRLRSDAVNLSTSCKDSDDEDCLFDVDDFLDKQLSKETLEKMEQDFEMLDQKLAMARASYDESERLSRHKRQIVDSIDEGSGTGPDDTLYANQTTFTNQGTYNIPSTIGVDFPNATITEQEKSRFKDELQAKIKEVFNSTLPGVIEVEVGEPVLTNGVLRANFTVTVDGIELNKAASELGLTNLEEYIFNTLRNSTIPAFNNITIFENLLNPGFTLDKAFVDNLRTILDDYCNSQNPCPDAGLEFDLTACVNNGFMSGYCPHKCSQYPCQNGAICELDDNFQPVCNCGGRYTGQYCETETPTDTGLTVGETVGVGVAGAAGCLALLSCCIYLACCRRRNQHPSYSYYEDEGYDENLSDPTSIANYYIDRPIISAIPIPVFNSHSGFDA